MALRSGPGFLDACRGHVGAAALLVALSAGCGDSGAAGPAASSGAGGDTGGSGAPLAGTGGLVPEGPATGGDGATGPATGGVEPGAGGSGVSVGGASNGGAPTGGGPLTGPGGSSTGGLGGTSGATTTGGTPAAGGTATGGTPAAGGAATGGTPAAGGAATGGTPAAGGAATGGTPAAGGAATGGAGGNASTPPTDLHAIAGNTTVGLEWTEVPGAVSYNVYWSTSSGVTPATGQLLSGVVRGHVERGLTNATTYYYVVTAVTSAGESAPSAEASATPGGEWVLEQLGTGDFEAVSTPGRIPVVPIEQRIHVLLFAEGYTADALATFHSETSHAGGDNDVDRWLDEVMTIEPYALFPEAFVVWFLPRASNTTIRDTPADTAFQVPLTLGTMASVGVPTSEVASRAWEAIGSFPYPAVAYDGPAWRDARNLVAAFLIYDPDIGRAYGSGLTTTLSNPSASGERIATAFAMGHAHEFTHAFSGLSDEYMETTSSAPGNWSDTSNVVGTNACSELPWAHLLFGSAINPDTDGLVGAFGDPSLGFHPELVCLLNGTHDNGEFFAGSDSGNCRTTSCTLRTDDRMCNFCREVTALRIMQRSGILPSTTDTWVSEYRASFYATYGLAVPDPVPQSNDVNRPENGTAIFQDCAP